MNIDKSKYIEINNILSGCRTLLDSYCFSEIYSKSNPEMKSVVLSMVNGKRYYDNIIDFKEMQFLLETLDKIQYKEDAEELINFKYKDITDYIQLQTIKRMIQNKLSKTNSYNIPNKYMYNEQSFSDSLFERNNYKITKNCPHCNHPCNESINMKYVICGYTDTQKGYDLVGCGKDWCFKCGKMLCKSWNTNQLFILDNRTHNKECCKKHANELNIDYEYNFCMCD